MFYSKQYNQYIAEGAAFTLGEVQYPSNWLNCASADEKEEAGLVEVQVVGSPASDVYYWVSTTLENGVLTYVNIPKELSVIQENCVSQVNATAYSTLITSDWMVNKAIETEVPMPTNWKEYRASVRATADAAKTAIAAATTVDAVAEVMTTLVWPKDPNQPIEEQV